MLSTYGTYRETSDRWFPPPPAHWTDTPIWTLFTREARKGHAEECLLSVYRDHGVVPKDSRHDNFNRPSEDLSGYQLVEPGDLVVNKMKAWQGSLSISTYRGIVSPAYFVYRPHHDADNRFLHHLLRAQPSIGAYIGMSKGVRIGQWDLEPQNFSRLKLSLPPLTEQQQIADYLDRETAQIDTLIQAQQQLVETLRERRIAASTAELGPQVGRGDRVKWAFEELDTRAGLDAEHLPLLSVSLDWGVRRRDETTTRESRAEDLSNYKVCRVGDLVINRMRAFQGALGVAGEDGLTSPDYAVLRTEKTVDGDWFAATMRTTAFVAEMASRVKGIGSADLGAARTPRINIADLGEIRIDIPPLAEQLNQLAAVRQLTARIDVLIIEAERFIQLSRERRSALITAAVTGQIDVRNEVA